MAVPQFFEFLKPILTVFSDGNTYSPKELRDKMIVHFQLSKEDQEKRVPSMKQTVLYNRVSWSCTYLRKAGLLKSVSWGFMKITDAGKKVLEENPPFIDDEYLKGFAGYRKFHNLEPDPNVQRVDPSRDNNLKIEFTPTEQMEKSFSEINQSLADDLLDEVLKMKENPSRFEKFVVDLMVQIGYGAMEYGSHPTRPTGDDGIDGVIMQDKLGFDLIYIQAKCWGKDKTVGQPDLQKFMGAITGKHGSGLFVTTAHFSDKAIEYAKTSHLILIDGEKLAKLMIESNFCVSVRKTFQIKDIDTDALNEYLEE
ncbi:restriction endonuclease [Dialister sp.]|uniref:restriction endonuclease n=1 Tax=Dialister sp. TaxID=1955814 RepID=UPI002E800C0E|nr:restriction endonuclease [Dialister sp.]MEE3453331.1 restriction endonuclease [Dialister sp.]